MEKTAIGEVQSQYDFRMSEMRTEALSFAVVAMLASAVLLVLLTEACGWVLYRDVLGLSLMFSGGSVLAIRQRSHHLAAWLLIIGCVAIDLLALLWVPDAGIASPLALPTGLAAVLLGMRSGAVVALLSTLITFTGAFGLLPTHAALSIAALVEIWGVLGLVWLALRPTRSAIEWTWANYRREHELLEEARDQRLELKQTQEDLVEANRELARLSDRLTTLYQIAEEARQAKQKFVANVSHELRTPLNVIIGFSDIISQSPEVYQANLPPVLLADIAAIRRNAEHLSSLVDDVLDLSQMNCNGMMLSKSWSSPQEIIESAAEAMCTFLEAKGLSLELAVPRNTPLVFCDATRVRQVVLNLLSNAARFTEKGKVTVRAHLEDNRVVVSVSDTGPGIPKNQQARLFEPFQQLDGSIRQPYGGSGLGLSISKRLVGLHDGEMWLESEVGVGTTVSFALPVGLAGPSPFNANSATRWFSPYQHYHVRERRSRVPASQPPVRYVVLEQGHSLQKQLQRYWEDAELISVSDEAAALAELRRSPAHALIVNTPEPEKVGLLSRSLSCLPYGTPAIACWVPGEEEAAQAFGVVSYMVKPVTRDELLEKLATLGEGVRTVLWVDDDLEALQLFARMLSTADGKYRVLRATSGTQALSILRKRHPDVMVLDLIMPHTDGFEVLKQKGQDPTIRSIPVLIVSARDPTAASASNTVLIKSDSDLSLETLLATIQAVSEVLAPDARIAHRAHL